MTIESSHPIDIIFLLLQNFCSLRLDLIREKSYLEIIFQQQVDRMRLPPLGRIFSIGQLKEHSKWMRNCFFVQVSPLKLYFVLIVHKHIARLLYTWFSLLRHFFNEISLLLMSNIHSGYCEPHVLSQFWLAVPFFKNIMSILYFWNRDTRTELWFPPNC